MKLFALFLVAAFLPARVGSAQASGPDEESPGGGSAAENGSSGQKSVLGPLGPAPGEGPPAAIPLDRETRVVLEHLDGRSFLDAGSLSVLGLERSGGRDVITFGDHRVAAAEALFLRLPARESPKGRSARQNAWIVLLRNGDTLRARILDAPPPPDADNAKSELEDSLRLLASSLGAAAVTVPLGAITALVPEAALYGRPGRLGDLPQAKAQLMRRLERMQVEEDVVLLRQGAGASGPQGARIEGIVESLSNQGVKISSDRLGEVEVSYSRLKALVLAQLEEDKEEQEESHAESPARTLLRVQLRLHDGSSLTARLDALNGVKASLLHGILGKVEVALEHVAEIAFMGGRVSYLSDREPVHVHEVPGPLFNETGRYAYKRDTNVLYGPLRMSGRIYRKGLGVHSYSLLQYALEEDDARFQTTIGLDDNARPFSTAVAAADVATVVFRVKVDGKLLFEKAMSWKDTPVPVEVPVKGGTKLSLEVDYGGVAGSMNSTLDRADWADARVVKNPE